MEDLSEIISSFVEERVDALGEGEQELWSEAVCAGLFSVAFHVVVRLKEIGNSPDAFNQTIEKIINSIENCASKWMNNRLSMTTSSVNLPKVEFDVSALVRARLISYFSEALEYLNSHGGGHNFDNARSHACFAILNSIVEALIIEGRILTADQGTAFLENVIDGCDSMATEIVEILDNYES